MDGDDWTPAIGWRRVGIRLLWAGAASMLLTLGTAEIVVKFFSSVGMGPDPGLPSVGFWGANRFSGSIAVAAGGIAGVLISWKLVERSSIMGAPLVGAVVAGIALVNLVAWRLGAALLGAAWSDQILFISIMAAGVATLIAAFRIFADS